MYPFSIGIMVQDRSLRTELDRALEGLPCRITADIAESCPVDLGINQLLRAKPDVVFVEIRADQGGAEPVIADLKQAEPRPTVVALHRAPSVEDVLAAMRAGANEFLQSPMADNLRAFMNRLQNGFRRESQGKLVGFISAKGGCGSTTLACHAAVEIANRSAEQKKRALLMDFDFNAGLTRFIMKSQGDYSVSDAINNLAKLDVDYWRRLVCSRHSGLDVLSAPEEWSGRKPLNRDHIQHVLGFVRSHYDWAILDLGKGFGQVAETALAELNELYIITTPEIGALHMSQNVYYALERAGYSKNRIRLVLNRVPKGGAHVLSEIEKAIGLPVYASLRNDYEALMDCYSSGGLLPRHNKLTADIQVLASKIMDEAIPIRQTSRMTRALTLCTSWMRA